MGDDNSKLKLLVISLSVFICVEWCKYKGSQLLSLILKSLIMIKTLFKFISVFFRYFKVVCWSSE